MIILPKIVEHKWKLVRFPNFVLGFHESKQAAINAIDKDVGDRQRYNESCGRSTNFDGDIYEISEVYQIKGTKKDKNK